MTPVLLLATPDAPPLEAQLHEAGAEVVARVTAEALVREVARAPKAELLVCWDAQPGAGLLAALRGLAEHAPLPVLLFTDDADAGTLEQALAAGVSAYVVDGYAPTRLRPLLQLARARFAHDHARRSELAQLASRFEERKLVDRAKGILMRARGLAEDEAFGVLRQASMQQQERVGRVSQRVIDAARDADAVNRAGQLRMLSQRLVKLYALRAAGIEADAAAAQQHEAATRARQNLEKLAKALSRATFGDLLDAAVADWAALERLLQEAPAVARLPALDAAAEQALASADRLTTALERASRLDTLAIVNLAGRQRMLSQRLAKQALIAALGSDAAAVQAAADAARTIATFEEALARLEAAPLSSASIRDGLARAAGEWQRLREAMAGAAGAAGQHGIAQASEALLAVFEQLTEQYALGAQQLFDGG